MMWLRALGAVLVSAGVGLAFVGGLILAESIGRPVR